MKSIKWLLINCPNTGAISHVVDKLMLEVVARLHKMSGNWLDGADQARPRI